jgi:cytochrome c oxidase cbb3-type subunit III
MTAPKEPTGQDRLLEHSYDGIQEYDNPMPRWWLMTFAGTILFSVVYLFNVGPVGNGKGRVADYEADVVKYAATVQGGEAGPSAERLLAIAQDRHEIEEGKQVFAKNCVACHRLDAGGSIGPNLTDEYWLHGGGLAQIYNTVGSGVLEKGMPPWKKTLTPKQLEEVVAYVASLKGTNPPNPKAPQGDRSPP